MGDRAVLARPGAYVAQDQESRGTRFPAFANVRTAGFLADGVQAVVIDDGLEAFEAGAAGHFGPEP